MAHVVSRFFCYKSKKQSHLLHTCYEKLLKTYSINMIFTIKNSLPMLFNIEKIAVKVKYITTKSFTKLVEASFINMI